MADANFDSFFGSGASAGGPVPYFARKRAVLNRSFGVFPDGFAGGGDYIKLPANSALPIEYRNSSDALVWTKTAANMFAGSTGWITFALSAAGLLYVVTTEGTGKIQLSSVDVAGTVTQIGAGFLPSPSMTGEVWDVGSSSGGASARIDGSNLVMHFTGRIITISLATGASVSAVASSCYRGSMAFGPYTLSVGTNSINQVSLRVRKDSGALGAQADTFAAGDCGLMSGANTPGSNTPFLTWGTEILRCSGMSTAAVGDYCLIFDPATITADVATLAANLRLNV